MMHADVHVFSCFPDEMTFNITNRFKQVLSNYQNSGVEKAK